MVDKQIVEEWIVKANEDLAFAKTALEEGLEFYPQICFYLHQATEKILKAYILVNELGFKKMHDLIKLLQICSQKDLAFNKFFETAELLNPFYIGTRYPDLVLKVNKSQTENALQIAEEIAAFVKQKINQQAEDKPAGKQAQGEENTETPKTEEAVEGEVVEDPSASSGQGEKKSD